MKIIVCKDYEQMSEVAVEIMGAEVKQNPKAVLGLATGSTPLGLYSGLARENKAGNLDFAEVKTYNLDEYYPMKPDNDQSYYYFMNENLFSKINIKKENCHLPNGLAEDADAEGISYDAAIAKAGGIDMQLLGIGVNGHIGFNEPSDDFTPATHAVTLTQSTREANSRFFASMDEVPTKALTMGFASIMQAKKVLMLINGANKQDAMYDMVCGKVAPSSPASILRLHGDVTVVCDAPAAAKLTKVPADVEISYKN